MSGRRESAGPTLTEPSPALPAWPAQASGPRAGTLFGATVAGLGGKRVGVCVGGGQTSCPALELLPAGAGRRSVWTEFGTD